MSEANPNMATTPSRVIASRLHWNNHARDAPMDAAKALVHVRAFVSRAAIYGDAVVLALGLPSPTEASTAFTDSVAAFAATLQEQVHAAVPVRIVPLTYWGQFVPALNAIIGTTATAFPDATHILFQSLEIEVSPAGVAHLQSHFSDGMDLVVGAALPGHDFLPQEPQPRPLDGRTTPWNTLALWDVKQLAKIGFPLVGDGLGLAPGSAGVEEVSAIALYQRLYPSHSRASVVQVPGLEWHVEDFADPERRAWQERKMASKRTRPAAQLAHLELPAGQVYHLK